MIYMHRFRTLVDKVDHNDMPDEPRFNKWHGQGHHPHHARSHDEESQNYQNFEDFDEEESDWFKPAKDEASEGRKRRGDGRGRGRHLNASDFLSSVTSNIKTEVDKVKDGLTKEKINEIKEKGIDALKKSKDGAVDITRKALGKMDDLIAHLKDKSQPSPASASTVEETSTPSEEPETVDEEIQEEEPVFEAAFEEEAEEEEPASVPAPVFDNPEEQDNSVDEKEESKKLGATEESKGFEVK